jgi:lysophospholipase L1-like esterase
MLRRFSSAFLAVALAVLVQPASAEPAAEIARPIRVSKIVLVGDSTTAVIGGWGPSFCAKHVTSSLACLNLARGGRSSASYRAEGSWTVALGELANPAFERTYVLIQFGHNDQPGKPGRSTDLATEFPANLKSYVAEARAKGAVPILVTPLTRRQFKDGKLIRDLEPWAETTRKVAADTGAPLLDLHQLSADAVDHMGALAATRFAQTPPCEAVRVAAASGTTVPGATCNAPAAAPAPAVQDNAAVEPQGQAKRSFDYTHLGDEGADYFAAMVTRELARVAPDLRPMLVP